MDVFENNNTSLPSVHGHLVVPSDTEDLPFIPRALYVNQGGTLVVEELDHTDTRRTHTYTVLTGALLSFRVLRVRATGTDAVVYARG